MRVGIYLDLRNPVQWARPWAAHYARAIELAVEAEARGAGSVWLSEHHLFEDGYLPQPVPVAAAIAARTSRIRIGTAVLIAPLRPALQLAEDAAILDLLSDGRFELGLGAGYRVPEFEAFGADPRSRWTETAARVRDVRRLLADPAVLPPPVQARLPIWVGHASRRGAHRVGLLGEGLLVIHPALVEPYRAGLAEGGHDPAVAQMAGLVNVVLADDPEAAWPRIRPHLQHQWDSYARHAVEGTAQALPAPIDPEALRGATAPVGLAPPFDVMTIDQAETHVRRLVADAPVVDVHLWASIAGMDDDLVDRHVELVGALAQRLA